MKIAVAVFALVSAACATAPRIAPLATGSRASLRGLSVVDARNVWASGSGGTVLRTIDGGATWRNVEVPGASSLDFRDVEAFDALHAVAMATAGKIYATSDGGANWRLVHGDRREGIFLDALAFTGATHGYALGDPIGGRFVLLETTDGGATWRDVPDARRPVAMSGESAFAASGTCLAAGGGALWIVTGGSSARVLRSDDDGRTWRASALPVVSGNDSSGAFGIAADASRAIVVGGDYKKPDEPADGLAASTGGGAAWQRGARLPFRSAAAFAGDAIVVTGTSGTDVSRDGRTWTRLAGGYNAVACRPGVCFLAGSDGRIARLRVR